VLALAIHLDDMIRRGEAKDYADVGRLTCLCRERISQIVRLNYLAPDIQVELLYLPPTTSGRFSIAITAAFLLARSASWRDFLPREAVFTALAFLAAFRVRLGAAAGALLLVPESIVSSLICFSCRWLRS